MKNLEHFNFCWAAVENGSIQTMLHRVDGKWLRTTNKYFPNGKIQWNLCENKLSSEHSTLEELYQNPGMAVLYLRDKLETVRAYAKHILKNKL